MRSGEAVALVKHCGLGGFPAAHNGAQSLSGQIVVLRRLCAKRSPHRLAPQDWDAKRPSTKGRANAQIVRPQPPSEAKPARAHYGRGCVLVCFQQTLALRAVPSRLTICVAVKHCDLGGSPHEQMLNPLGYPFRDTKRCLRTIACYRRL